MHTKIKKGALALATMSLLLLGSVEPVLAQSAENALVESPRVMLYASKGFGSSARAKHVTNFGLRYEQPLLRTQSRWQFNAKPTRFMPMFDLRLTPGIGRQFLMSNVPMYQSAGYSADSSTEESWRNPWFWAGVGAAALVVSCTTDNWPCEDDDDDTSVSPGLD